MGHQENRPSERQNRRGEGGGGDGMGVTWDLSIWPGERELHVIKGGADTRGSTPTEAPNSFPRRGAQNSFTRLLTHYDCYCPPPPSPSPGVTGSVSSPTLSLEYRACASRAVDAWRDSVRDGCALQLHLQLHPTPRTLVSRKSSSPFLNGSPT